MDEDYDEGDGEEGGGRHHSSVASVVKMVHTERYAHMIYTTYREISAGFNFSQMVNLYHFTSLNFRGCAQSRLLCVLYNEVYSRKFNFHIRQSSVKTAKIGPLENFLLYSI